MSYSVTSASAAPVYHPYQQAAPGRRRGAAQGAAQPRRGGSPGQRAIDSLQAPGKRALAKTYGYTGGGVALSAAAAAATAAVAPPLGLGLGLGASLGAAGAMLGALWLPREQSLARQACGLAFALLQGVALSSVAAVSTPVLAQAALGTAAVTAATTAAAGLLPIDRFRSWQGPLFAALLGVTSVGTLSLCMPQSWVLAQAGQAVSLYGGLALFSAFLLHDSGRILAQANHPRFDPLAASFDLYLHAMNIFVRLLEILERAQRRERK